MTDQQVAARICGSIKAIDQIIFCLLVKIYHDITAKDHIKFDLELYG